MKMAEFMDRLTEPHSNGTWYIKFLPWMDIAEGRTITRATAERLYACLDRLKEYEDTGLTPDEIRERGK